MKPIETPIPWRQGFVLYRRRTGTDSLGNETAVYDMDAPDAEFSDQQGLDFQRPRGWNSSGSLGKAGSRVEERGEVPGGVLEAYLIGGPEIAPFDRLEAAGELWEVRDIHRWPAHRELLLQRVK